MDLFPSVTGVENRRRRSSLVQLSQGEVEALSRWLGEVESFLFTYGDWKPMTVLEIVGVIQKLMRGEHLHPILKNTAKGEILSQYLSSEKAERH